MPVALYGGGLWPLIVTVGVAGEGYLVILGPIMILFGNAGHIFKINFHLGHPFSWGSPQPYDDHHFSKIFYSSSPLLLYNCPSTRDGPFFWYGRG